MASAVPAGGLDNHLSSTIQVHIRCSNLKSLDLLSKSDPFAVLNLSQERFSSPTQLGISETIENDNDPIFQKQFVMEYLFEENQTLRMDIYDRDSKSNDLSKHDRVGYVQTVVGDLVAAPGQKLKLVLMNPKTNKQIRHQGKPSTCTIMCEEQSKNLD
eukprot:248196_1